MPSCEYFRGFHDNGRVGRIEMSRVVGVDAERAARLMDESLAIPPIGGHLIAQWKTFSPGDDPGAQRTYEWRAGWWRPSAHHEEVE